MAADPETSRTPFHDLQEFVGLPRLSGLTLSADGSRLVTTVSELDPDRTRYVGALWEVDPAGEAPARRLTRGGTGQSAPVFTPDGDLLFSSARPDPDAPSEPADSPSALWSLPAHGGEARLLGSRPGGIGGVVVARAAGTVVATSSTLPGAVDADDDERRRTARRESKITAILHDGHPVRHWDHDIGPAEPRLLAAAPVAAPAAASVEGPDARLDWADLTPVPGHALLETAHNVSPDGRTVVTGWNTAHGHGAWRSSVVAIDVATGDRRVLLDDPSADFSAPRVSPDGTRVVALRETVPTPERAPRIDLVVVALDGGDPVPVAPDWDRWPAGVRWTADSSALVVVADEGGRAPLFRVDPATGTVLRLTGDHGAYSDPCPSPDGRWVYALRNAVDSPPAPVRVDAHTADGVPEPLAGPVPEQPLPGRLTEVTASAADGSALRAWLALPHDASTDPAPLLLWIHGGPLSSWNAWSWRWNPWLMVARGYAVLLPDPALSTGYGQDFVQRGWGVWGGPPYTDLMAVTDAAEALPEIDAGRTAAMGGSFGGYMANWVAGHTDRFRAIVTHASLWALDQFGPTTDHTEYWRHEMSPAMAEANSPHRHAHAITTPMLVIHGDRDYRVPIGEGLRLWWDLTSRQPDPAANPHRFLYFPDENHWVLSPQHSALWYETVHAFLATHVLGREWQTPDLLR
ncbi:alpha/beta fold hydrolase [Pseudonocardia sp. KRD291]|uniref:S9 family peptidase n=1 Tax=Pseudonocardia sp. KRD291 TaxID=2792007 RepID=UPI001C4A50C1|nr:alpha/beta fold hydrolase [Pseudonocardia sp. KRD291]MBW0105860.1 S9 family peptidase [Pseudonocardia sp. KRD291]